MRTISNMAKIAADPSIKDDTLATLLFSLILFPISKVIIVPIIL